MAGCYKTHGKWAGPTTQTSDPSLAMIERPLDWWAVHGGRCNSSTLGPTSQRRTSPDLTYTISTSCDESAYLRRTRSLRHHTTGHRDTAVHGGRTFTPSTWPWWPTPSSRTTYHRTGEYERQKRAAATGAESCPWSGSSRPLAPSTPAASASVSGPRVRPARPSASRCAYSDVAEPPSTSTGVLLGAYAVGAGASSLVLGYWCAGDASGHPCMPHTGVPSAALTPLMFD